MYVEWTNEVKRVLQIAHDVIFYCISLWPSVKEQVLVMFNQENTTKIFAMEKTTC